MALAMALLALLVSVVLSALLSPAVIWTDQLPKHLQANLGQYMNSTQLATIYGSIAKARASLLFACVVPLAAGLLTSNFWLGDSHNAIEVVKKIVIRSEEETREEVIREKVKATEERIGIEVGRL
ncbi:hypothetical protein CNBF3980 [Cryptococcus deneoformans B-3501A]|uniref:hypothetical protein n=1 Tax=Cryptococcus deneoformans (strain B-3501A) TaxID=283643 RepID=UPI000042F05D|nr:hypothetical protein CNBF3980 [Cryptococcus neoformans var. neoformans B-3501A]EAL20072.1 hypothetical protein CNBF3980 [Cryptococcus neoformans var. neoformans B-3501A]